MQRLHSPSAVTISWDKHGSGPPLVLVHGAFSDHRTNWELVVPLFERQFTVFAIARRGRGETTATAGHNVEDESRDVAALIQSVGAPVFLLGHSYGAHVALAAAKLMPDQIRKLVLYEAPWPHIVRNEVLESLASLARAGDWESFSSSFFHRVLSVPMDDLNALRATRFWRPIVEDAAASLADLQAINRYDFRAERYADLEIPTLLQIGTESPRSLYVTDSLMAALPNAQIQELPGQAHEGMTTAPDLYASVTAGFLLDASATRGNFAASRTAAV